MKDRVASPEENSGATAATLEKVRSALRNLGFRDADARRAIARVVLEHPREIPSLEQTLREAILVATAA